MPVPVPIPGDIIGDGEVVVVSVVVVVVSAGLVVVVSTSVLSSHAESSATLARMQIYFFII
jgi:hypothetical protein